MPTTSLTPDDFTTINGVTYIPLELANRLMREALDAIEPLGEWLSAKEAAQLAHRSVHAIYDAAKRGEIEGYVPNGMTRGLRLRRSSVEDWMTGRPIAKGETDA